MVYCRHVLVSVFLMCGVLSYCFCLLSPSYCIVYQCTMSYCRIISLWIVILYCNVQYHYVLYCKASHKAASAEDKPNLEPQQTNKQKNDSAVHQLHSTQTGPPRLPPKTLHTSSSLSTSNALQCVNCGQMMTGSR